MADPPRSPLPGRRPVLPNSVEESLEAICRDQGLYPPDHVARLELAKLGESAALKILREISRMRVRSLPALIVHMAKNSDVALARNAEDLCTQESACFSGPRSPNVASVGDYSSCEMPQHEVPLGHTFNPHMVALGELEFRKAFMILSYAGRNKLQDLISVELIKKLECLPMVAFESELWNAVGRRCISDSDRRKNLDWQSTKTHCYHCHVNAEGHITFKGPYLQDTKTHLHRVLGDDNVLLVKFAEEKNGAKHASRGLDSFSEAYHTIAQEGIIVGLRRYKFFVYKDGGKEEKKKNPTSSPVKCYFVRTESSWAMDVDKAYILCNKSIHEARCIFMHVHTVDNLAKYMARFSLILSKTSTLDIDLSCVNIMRIEDIPCMDEDRKVVYGVDGEPMIHTDGTGYISEDLAMLCPKHISKKRRSTPTDNQKVFGTFGAMERSFTGEPPLLIQFRLFNNGCAVKGTLLLNKELPSKTIQIRRSMIKVEADPKIPTVQSCNSLEIVQTSNQPKGTCLSRFLIALLHYGGVPKEYFLDLLTNALDDAQNARYSKKAALRVALRYGSLDNFLLSRMILCGVPIEEPYLQSRLLVLLREEWKGLKMGKIPVNETYYLMGTADPTGTLGPNEVCIILDNGQVSGDVLVYKHPGLHFGDIHRLTATYIKDMEKIVGNSKFAIFFPIEGPRSLADEMANSDFDGDMYWVSRDPQLLELYKPSKPWVRSNSAKKKLLMKPDQFSNEGLEHELFQQFLQNRFNPSYAISEASDCWMVYMDRLLTIGHSCPAEKECLIKKMLQLVDIYYDALDASKSGLKVEVPGELKARLYPHFMGRENKYHSTSILGLIHDKVESFQTKDLPPIDIWQLSCFGDKVPEPCLVKWRKHYDEYRKEMAQAIRLADCKDEAADDVIHKYKKILYGAPEFEQSTRRQDDIFDEARAIYQIVYDYAKDVQNKAIYENPVGRCSFAWKVAGHALCMLHAKKLDEEVPPMVCARSALQEVIGY